MRRCERTSAHDGALPSPQVEPVTYEETLLWLEGRRRWALDALDEDKDEGKDEGLTR